MLFTVSPKNGLLNGILRTLYDRNKTYYYEAVTVKAQDTCRNGDLNNPENILNWENRDNQRYWSSLGEKDHWITLILLKGFVSITHYSLQTTTDNDGSLSAPKEWYVYGSLDNKTYREIDYKNTDETNTSPSTFNYQTKRGVFKYFKFLQKQNHCKRADYKGSFVVKRIELFGIYHETLFMSAKKKIHNLSVHFILLILIPADFSKY